MPKSIQGICEPKGSCADVSRALRRQPDAIPMRFKLEKPLSFNPRAYAFSSREKRKRQGVGRLSSWLQAPLTILMISVTVNPAFGPGILRFLETQEISLCNCHHRRPRSRCPEPCAGDLGDSERSRFSERGSAAATAEKLAWGKGIGPRLKYGEISPIYV